MSPIYIDDHQKQPSRLCKTYDKFFSFISCERYKRILVEVLHNYLIKTAIKINYKPNYKKYKHIIQTSSSR